MTLEEWKAGLTDDFKLGLAQVGPPLREFFTKMGGVPVGLKEPSQAEAMQAMAATMKAGMENDKAKDVFGALAEYRQALGMIDALLARADTPGEVKTALEKKRTDALDRTKLLQDGWPGSVGCYAGEPDGGWKVGEEGSGPGLTVRFKVKGGETSAAAALYEGLLLPMAGAGAKFMGAELDPTLLMGEGGAPRVVTDETRAADPAGAAGDPAAALAAEAAAAASGEGRFFKSVAAAEAGERGELIGLLGGEGYGGEADGGWRIGQEGSGPGLTVRFKLKGW